MNCHSRIVFGFVLAVASSISVCANAVSLAAWQDSKAPTQGASWTFSDGSSTANAPLNNVVPSAGSSSKVAPFPPVLGANSSALNPVSNQFSGSSTTQGPFGAVGLPIGNAPPAPPINSYQAVMPQPAYQPAFPSASPASLASPAYPAVAPGAANFGPDQFEPMTSQVPFLSVEPAEGVEIFNGDSMTRQTGSSTRTVGNDGFSILPRSESSKFPTAKLTGFFQLDSAWFSQDAENLQTLGDIDDGLGFRRARFAGKGNVSEEIQYIFEFDIAQSQARFVDVWLQKDNTRFGNVRIGRFRQPYGMSELTSVRELPFLERPVTFTQSPFRQTGVMLFDTTPDEYGTWAVSGIRFLSDNFGNVFSDTGGYGIVSRLTRIALEWGNDRLLHFGADYSFSDPGRGQVQLVSTNEVFVGQNPNIGPSGLSVLPIIGVTPFVNTGLLDAENVELFNVEGALALGRMAIQSEARVVRVERASGEVLSFPGAYAQLRYMMTGETIPYSRKNGVFGRIVPRNDWNSSGGIGAWEVLGRVSHLDLNDADINGGRLTDFTVGCNWYWNRYTKMQFNWIHSRLNDDVIGDSRANAFAIRAQLDF